MLNQENRSTRDAYGDALLALAKTNKNIVVVSADLAESTRVQAFGKKYPARFIEVGVAEQNMLGVAAGLALAGKTVFASSFAVFSPGRNWDQLRVSVCYSKSNVKIVSSHAGLSGWRRWRFTSSLRRYRYHSCLAKSHGDLSP
jgi:transketolase